ncbi:hypothetical protein J6590_005790 [Homalodisca vitripennis]|nr:hypothetical protein J6590_005790 [Homalodisca vitripennis]
MVSTKLGLTQQVGTRADSGRYKEFGLGPVFNLARKIADVKRAREVPVVMESMEDGPNQTQEQSCGTRESPTHITGHKHALRPVPPSRLKTLFFFYLSFGNNNIS